MLESVDIDYENTLISIYNSITGEESDENNPFLAAIRVPGRDYIPGEEEATDPDRTTENQEEDVDQGG